jgi:hypothetical protein
MLRHAVIVVGLPAGLNTGELAQGISARIERSTPSPMPDPTGRPGAQVPASAHPDREELPDAPRFRHARRADPLGVEPVLSLGRTADLFRSIVTALGLTASPRHPERALFPSTHRRYSSPLIRLIVYRNLPVPISPQGVRRAPHERQQVILCTWPLSFGNLASASWQ